MFNIEDYKKNIEVFNKSFLDMLKPFAGSFKQNEKVDGTIDESINKLDQANKIISETMQKLAELQTNYFSKCAQNIQGFSKCSENPSSVVDGIKNNSDQMIEHISEITKIIADSHSRLTKI